MNKLESDYYKPMVLKEIQIDGVLAKSARAGEETEIFQKAFFTSVDLGFEKICNNLLAVFGLSATVDSLNRLLILIKPDRTAYAYVNLFPEMLTIKMKREKKAGHAVFADDIVDISGVRFKDAIFELNYQEGDKLIWLFRRNWKFGLFFDLTGKTPLDKLTKELGDYYRYLSYIDLYFFLQNQDSFFQLVDDGWFPFIQLLGGKFQDLIASINDTKEYQIQIESILKYFDHARVKDFTDNWWKNSIYRSKREILEAGINAYFEGSKAGYINAIKNLSTEIEGIIRIAYHRHYLRNPTTKELKRFVKERGEDKFSSARSLGFPNLFFDYLNESLFKGFDLEKLTIPASRHSIAHGVMESEKYSQMRGLQLILILDQIYFFLGADLMIEQP